MHATHASRGAPPPTLAMPTLAPTPRGYFEAARSHRYSILFALPLFVLYELLALAHPGGAFGGVRNGAEVMLIELLSTVAGARAPIVLGACLIAGAVLLVVRDQRRHRTPLRGAVFLGMAAESVALALAFGLVVGTITAYLLGPLRALAIAPQPIERMGLTTRIMMSLGAGLYEELLFRVILVSALAAGARIVLGWSRGAAGVLATIAGALLFAAAHYIGPYGDPLALPSFVFRTVSGLFFSALYLWRGFGITAWTHALYDLFLLVL